MRVWELVSIVFLGLMAMGNIDSVDVGLMDVGSYGTGTGDAVSLMFFLFVFAVIGVSVRTYFDR